MFRITQPGAIQGARISRSKKASQSPVNGAGVERLESRCLLSVAAPVQGSAAAIRTTAPQLTATANTEPSIAPIPNATVKLGSTFSYQVIATGSPAPTLSLSSPPAGMVINSTTGIITWKPTSAQVGTSTIRVRAVNSVDSISRSFSIVVTNYSAPVITTPTNPSATAGATFTYQMVAAGSPTPAFSLVSGPAGMSISATGLITWSPAAGLAGSAQSVTVSATNSIGAATSTFAISVVPDTTPPTAPTLTLGPIVSTTAIPLSWSGSTDNVGVAGYRIFSYTPAVYRGHSGRGGGYTLVSPAKYTLLVDGVSSTSYTISGLQPGTTYQYAVAAYDAAGNQSAYSTVVSGATLLTPSFTWTLNGVEQDPAMSVVANHSLSFLIYLSGSPYPNLSLVSAPAGTVFTPGQITNSQLTYVTPNIAWTPTPDEVGVQYITMQATNLVGSFTYSIPVTVTPDTPQISLSINGGITYGSQQYASGQSNYVVNVNPAYGSASQPQYGMVGVPFNFQVASATNTNPVSYELVSGPDGMSIDPNTGVGTWTPTAAEAGATAVTIAATNDAGTSTLELSLPTYSSSAPGTPSATYYVDTSGVMTPNPTITWAPAADTSNVADYLVNVTTANGNLTTHFDTGGTATSYALSGLTSQQYFVSVTPVDAAGNPGLTSSAVSLDEVGLPNVTWTAGQQNAIVGQPATMQFGSPNSSGLTYTLVSGPAGATIDPNTGLLTWTPTAPGNAQIVVAINAQPLYNWGAVVATVNVPVFFADSPTALAVSTDGTLTATWTPPALNVSAVTAYQVQIVPSASSGGSPILLDIPASLPLSVAMADLGVTSGSIQVTALDASGDLSVASQWVTF